MGEDEAKAREATGATRRGVLDAGKKLVYAAPAVIAALHAGVASADDDSKPGRRLARGHSFQPPGLALGHRETPPSAATTVTTPGQRRPGLVVTYRARLCRMADVADLPDNLGGQPNNGNDQLSAGEVRVLAAAGSWDGTVHVALRGAPANTQYQVIFLRLNDLGGGGVNDLGNITTDGNGNFRGPTPNKVPDPGGNKLGRQGVFVLRRNNQNHFVSCVGGRR
jgi:hypothetical protein